MDARIVRAAALAIAGWSFVCAGLASAQQQEPAPAAEAPKVAAAVAPVKPKELTGTVKNGLKYLAQSQHKDGSWGQGDESAQMGNTMEKVRDMPNVADTCMATLALMRAGSTPKSGDYKDNVRSAVSFVCAQVEEADEKSLWITNTRGTRTQQKLGTNIDTFLAARVLTEAKGTTGSEADELRVERALAKVLKKIELNQKDDGRFAQAGWAPVLAQAEVSKAYNAASAKGVAVNEQSRQRLEEVAQADFSLQLAGGAPGAGIGADAAARPATGAAAGEPAVMFRTRGAGGGGVGGDAGVALYSNGAILAGLQSSATANQSKRVEYQEKLKDANLPAEERERYTKEIVRFNDNDQKLFACQQDIAKKLDDARFVAGFGSNGGEEFLSYMNIGESFVLKGGEEWTKWDKAMTENLSRIQNKDGSWSGHHCVTGKTFCTSSALMTLMTDRVTRPGANEIRKQR